MWINSTARKTNTIYNTLAIQKLQLVTNVNSSLIVKTWLPNQRTGYFAFIADLRIYRLEVVLPKWKGLLYMI